MIVADTSALLAVILGEPEGPQCRSVLASADEVLISAGTLAEAMVVARRKGARRGLDILLETLSPSIVPLTEASARQTAEAYDHWGKGLHPAKLTFADCFAYVLSKDSGWPLLFIGNDFAQTDVDAVLPPLTGLYEP